MSVSKKAIGIICNSKELFLSLKRALSLYFPNAHFYFYDTNTTNGRFNLTLFKGKNFKHQLRKCRLIIAVAYQDTEPSEIIRLIHHLRSNLTWEGSFFVIVNREDEKQHLLDVNLIGERAERFHFRELPGHAVICLPFLLRDLLDKIVNLEDMNIEVWDSLVSASLVGDISKEVNEAEKAKNDNDIQKALDMLSEILCKMKQVDWLIWLYDPHNDLPRVNKVIEMSSREHPVDKSDCSTIINNIREILSKSLIRI